LSNVTLVPNATALRTRLTVAQCNPISWGVTNRVLCLLQAWIL
jgi:hypothetical protein